ncbi:MAG: ECF transporter S component [Clostridia bacterium]|nr:ECF transporter S component [Clostridia bacterium]
MAKTNKKSIVRMTELAILTAIVLILQLLGIGIKLPFLATPVSLVLIPIVLGATVLGPKAGAWLGLVFGLEVYIVAGVMGMDFFTMTLFNNHPIVTFLICVVKSTLAGFLCGVVYQVIAKKNELLATFVAAAVAPIVNTGVFIIGCLFISGTLESNFVSEGSTVIYFLIIGCAGLNFVIEFFVNMIFAPALNRLVNILNKRIS